MAVAASLVIDIRGRVEKLVGALRTGTKALNKFGRKAQRVGRNLTTTFTLPIAAVGVGAVRAFANFDDAMTKSLAIMGNVSGVMKNKMSEAAKQVAKDTTFSAAQAAEGYFFLASAGLDAKESIAALPQVAKFAQAGNFDLATATDLATDAQSALGLSVGTAQEKLTNLTRVTDVLVKANTLANASVEQFSQALTSKAGAALKSVNKSIEEGVAVLAVFADQGTKAQDAGTALSIVMRDLQTKNIKNAKAFEKAGVAVYDQTGKMRNLADIIGDVEGALDGMSDVQKKATLLQMGFSDKSVGFVQKLVGSSAKIKEYEEALKSAGGMVQLVADNQLKSFSSQMSLFKNRVELAGISLGEMLAPKVRVVTDAFTLLLDWFEKLNPTTKDLIVNVGLFVAALGPLVMIAGSVALAIAALGAPLLLIVVGVGTVLTALWTFRDELPDIWYEIKSTFYDSVDSIIDLFNRFLLQIHEFISGIRDFQNTVRGYLKLPPFREIAPPGLINKIKREFTEPIEEGAEKAGESLGEFADKAKAAGKSLNEKLGPPAKATAEDIARLTGKTEKHTEAQKEAKKKTDEYKSGLERLDDRITSISDTFRRTDISAKVKEAFGHKSQQTNEEFAKSLRDIQTELVNTTEDIEEMDRALAEGGGDGSGGGFLDGIFDSLTGSQAQASIDGFSKELGAQAFTSLSGAVTDALKNGFSGDTLTGLVDSAGGIFGSITGVPVVGDFFANAINNIIGGDFESTSGIIDVAGNVIDTIFPGIGTALSAALGSVFSDGSNASADAQVGMERWIEDRLAEMIEAGRGFMVQNGDGIMEDFGEDFLGDQGRWSTPGWAEAWWESMDTKSAEAFLAVTTGLQGVLGITEDVSGQMAVLFSEQLYGSVDNLRGFVQTLGLDFEQMEAQIIRAGLRAGLTFHEIEVQLQGLRNAFGTGLEAVGAFDQGFQNLINSGGKGYEAIKALKDIAIEAKQAGITSLDELQEHLRQTGKFTEQQIATFMQGLASRGITSLEDLESVSDATAIGIVADMQTLKFPFEDIGEAAGNAESEVEGLGGELEDLPSEVDVKINVHTNYTSEGEAPAENASGGVVSRIRGLPRFAAGGVVSRPTLFSHGGGGLGLMGEAGAEAILPLKRINGKLGVMSSGAGGFNIFIDATGAGPGVENNIIAAIEAMKQEAIEGAVYAVGEAMARGGM